MERKSRCSRKNQRLQDGHITAWRKSGLDQSEYCRQHKLRQSTFAGWLAQEQGSTVWPVALVPVPDKICHLVRVGESGATGLNLVVGRRCRIEIDRQFDAETFARLVAVLEEM